MTETANMPPTRTSHRTERREKLWNAHNELTEQQMALKRDLIREESPAKRVELNRVESDLRRITNQLDATYK